MSRTAEAVVDRISARQKVALVPEVLRAYREARRALSRSDLPTILQDIRGDTNGSEAAFSPERLVVGKQLGGAVRRTLAPIPTRSRCLLQSLTLTTMLARRGIETSLVIGVKPGEEKFGAHAWVEYHGRPLLPVLKRRFERLTEV